MSQTFQFNNQRGFYETLFGAVAQIASDSIFISDENFNIIFANKKACETFGYTDRILIGSDFKALMPERYRDEIRRFMHTERTNFIGQAIEMEGVRKDGSIFPIELSLVSGEEEGSDYISSIIKDKTERKNANARPVQMKEDPHKRINDLKQFSYMISHNLRSPLAGAMGLVDVLISLDRNSAEFDITLGFLKESIFTMDTVLEDLRTILSARDHKETIKERIELAPVCQQVVREQQESLNKCGGKVSLDFEDGIKVQGNRAYVYSIFHNLLSNAIKYHSPERVLKISIECFRSKEGGITISFSDNGSGFDVKSVGENLFKLYQRFHSNVEGRGIGMFLVKSHIESMGGSIEVESKVNEGTTFIIYLK